MRKVYHLSSCSTCQRIIATLGGLTDFVRQDIKADPLTAAQLDEMKARAGSYEALFSRRAIKYKSMGLKDKVLAEKDYRRLILEDYTFLKRPVVMAGEEIFIGNAPAEVERASATFLGGKVSGNAT